MLVLGPRPVQASQIRLHRDLKIFKVHNIKFAYIVQLFAHGTGVSGTAINFGHPVLTPRSVWPNGKALDYESRDSGFDPQHDQNFFFYLEAVIYVVAGKPRIYYSIGTWTLHFTRSKGHKQLRPLLYLLRYLRSANLWVLDLILEHVGRQFCLRWFAVLGIGMCCNESL